MSLTVGGFAPPRTVPLRGKGGTRGRGDNGASPPAGDRDTRPAPREHNGNLATPPREQNRNLATAPREQNRELATAPRERGRDLAKALLDQGRKLPTALPGQNHKLSTALLERERKVRPAALEWQDVQVPLVGRLWATAWLPSILLAGCVLALLYLLQTAGVATTGYDIQRLQAERDDWQLRNEQLKLELAKRHSLTWIESEATARLGMVRPEPTALTYVKVAR